MRARTVLRAYSEILGLAISFFAFVWVMFQIYLVAHTSEDQHDLLMARYLDISFGLLAFSSSLALMYGAFVESKTWLSAWTLGSATVVVGMWVWYFYRKFNYPPHPEVVRDGETAGIVLTAVYVGCSVPVWVFQNMIEYWDLRPMCSLDWWCPTFLLSAIMPFRRREGQTLLRRSPGSPGEPCNGRRISLDGAPNCYAQCTTNTFLAPLHAPVQHIPVSKEEDLFNPV